MKTGDRIKQLRIMRLMTQEELAEKTGLAAASLSRIENNLVNPSIRTLKALTKALDVDITEILQFDEE